MQRIDKERNAMVAVIQAQVTSRPEPPTEDLSSIGPGYGCGICGAGSRAAKD